VNRFRTTATRLLKLAAIASAVFSLLTLFNQWHQLLELFSHFRLQYLLVSIFLTLIFAAMREKTWAGALLLLTLINVWPVAYWYTGKPEVANSNAQVFTVLQANVYGGNHNTALLLDLIMREQPDLIFLQEVTATWVTALAQLDTSYPYNYAVPLDGSFGIAVYARDELLSVDKIDSPPLGLPTLVVRQSIDGTTTTFVNTHPFPPMGTEWIQARNEQLVSLAALMQSISGPKALLGDLNISMWASHYRQLIESTELRNTRKGFGVIPTWPRRLPFASIPIDHCLISEEFVALDFRAGPDIGSDHLPLIIKLSLQ
jgi:endonuclease/exonuclease/phosphatase (EEP) superfamily protein YafD